jgi:hypothetical protein
MRPSHATQLLMASALLAGALISGPATAADLAPLKLYWSAARGDNFTTATKIGELSARDAGYSFSRVEGYVFPAGRCD